MTPTTATDMYRMLDRHYLPPNRPSGGLLLAEVPTPDGTRQADAIWAPTTHSERMRIIGHEIKVTRSDVLAELADPTKADTWAQYCTRWWLVVADPALVDGLDIPDRWGIMAPPSGRRRRSMTILRAAPLLTPVDNAGPAFWRLMSTAGKRAASQQHRVEYERDTAIRQAERMTAQLREARLSGGRTSGHVPETTRIAEEVARLLAADPNWCRRHPGGTDTTATDIATAIGDLRQARAATRNLIQQLNDTHRAMRRLTDPSPELTAARDALLALLPDKHDDTP